ncbi:uncharacterized protein [Heterodontus francisci]
MWNISGRWREREKLNHCHTNWDWRNVTGSPEQFCWNQEPRCWRREKTGIINNNWKGWVWLFDSSASPSLLVWMRIQQQANAEILEESVVVVAVTQMRSLSKGTAPSISNVAYRNSERSREGFPPARARQVLTD